MPVSQCGHRSRRSDVLDEVPAPVPEPPDQKLAEGIGPWAVARNNLSKTAFTVLWLRYHEDWNVTEIARCLLRPTGWVRLSLHRARKRLATLLEEPS